MDKRLFLMIGALTSNVHQNHEGTPLRQYLHEFLAAISSDGWALLALKNVWREYHEVLG